MRIVLAARSGNGRSARSLANLDALIELARPFDVRGLRAFVRYLQADWERGAARLEGRIDASEDAIEIVTIHSAKGLEWPVVIPINMGTLTRSNERFVHRASDNTLHWVIGNVASSALAVARDELAHRQELEDQRKWYVACTRARDLLVVPNLAAAKSGSWAKLLNLRFDQLQELEFNHLVPAASQDAATTVAAQDLQTFHRQQETIQAASVEVKWTNPSAHDADREDAVVRPTSVETEGGLDYVEPLGAGSLRGLVLHKLMEELLTGELLENGNVTDRARRLLDELVSITPEPGFLPEPSELASTALRTRGLPYVSRIWSSLVPEFAVWSQVDATTLLAGRADAVAITDGRIVEVLDWKSDRDPLVHRAQHVNQMQRYLAAVGAAGGAIVYMSTGEVVSVTREPPA